MDAVYNPATDEIIMCVWEAASSVVSAYTPEGSFLRNLDSGDKSLRQPSGVCCADGGQVRPCMCWAGDPLGGRRGRLSSPIRPPIASSCSQAMVRSSPP
jgi:hypothetical protein